MTKSNVVKTVYPNCQRITRREDGSLLVEHIFSEESMTQQSFKDMTDVNLIMKKFLRGGPLPVSSDARAVFMDVSHGMDYREVLERTMEAQEAFDSLPSDMRARFGHDVANVLDFVGNPANYNEAVKLGLIDGDLSSISNMGGVTPPSEQSSLDVTVRTDTTVV